VRRLHDVDQPIKDEKVCSAEKKGRHVIGSRGAPNMPVVKLAAYSTDLGDYRPASLVVPTAMPRALRAS